MSHADSRLATHGPDAPCAFQVDLTEPGPLQGAFALVVVVSIVAYFQPPTLVLYFSLALLAAVAWTLPTPVDFSLYVLLLGVQLPGSTFSGRWAVADLFLLPPIARMFVSAWRVKRERTQTSLMAPMLALTAVMAFGTIVGVARTGHLTTYMLLNKDAGMLFLIFGALAFVYELQTLDDARRAIDLFVTGVGIVNLIALAAAVVNIAGFPNLVSTNSGRMNGLLLNPTSYGSLILVAVMLELPRMADPRSKAFAPASVRWVNYALLLASLSMTLSRSTWLSLAAGAGTLIAAWFVSGNVRRISPRLWAGAIVTLVTPIGVLLWIAMAHGSTLKMLSSGSQSRAEQLYQQALSTCATRWEDDLCLKLPPALIAEERAKLAREASVAPTAPAPASFLGVNPDGALMNARGLEDRAAIIQAGLRDYRATWVTTLTGIGLGTFLATSASTFGVPLIVHNTVIWFLIEMGPLGLAALAWFLGQTAFNLWRIRKLESWPGEIGHGITAALAGWFVLSMFNEVFYLRHFWLLVILADRLYVLSRTESAARPVATDA